MKSAQSLCRMLERVEQGDEEADALEVGATGDALVGAVDAAVAFVIVDHKGGEADALVANALVVGGIGCTNHGRGHDAHRLLAHRRRSVFLRLSKLEVNGLIERSRNPKDRRQLTIRLTETGRENARIDQAARIRFRERAFSAL